MNVLSLSLAASAKQYWIFTIFWWPPTSLKPLPVARAAFVICNTDSKASLGGAPRRSLGAGRPRNCANARPCVLLCS
eukprot:1870852-Pyramimonas_sp.AAC.1